MKREKQPCGSCGEPLDWLGRQTQKVAGGEPVRVEHWACAACGRRWVHHSERGWRETKVDLTAD
jgi:hypothetical protein